MNDKQKFKIAVVGIGGVGGYVGGKLTARFENSETVEVVLAARGANEKAIRAGGLKIVTNGGEQIVKPKLITTAEIGDADLLLLCTKEYDLEETISALKDFVGRQTTVLPLLNGVDAAGRIARILPENEVWQGCIYIISKLESPGVVRESGDVCLIYFGDGNRKSEKADFVESVFNDAKIDARFAENIVAKTWDKFIFISAAAAATSYLDADFSELFARAENVRLLDDLLAEIKSVAAAKKVDFSEDSVRQSIDKIKNVAPGATTSMHRDFSHGKSAELHSLVGYVVKEARKLDVPTPVYGKVYGELMLKQTQTAGE